jgi:hypothetical protein
MPRPRVPLSDALVAVALAAIVLATATPLVRDRRREQYRAAARMAAALHRLEFDRLDGMIFPAVESLSAPGAPARGTRADPRRRAAIGDALEWQRGWQLLQLDAADYYDGVGGGAADDPARLAELGRRQESLLAVRRDLRARYRAVAGLGILVPDPFDSLESPDVLRPGQPLASEP